MRYGIQKTPGVLAASRGVAETKGDAYEVAKRSPREEIEREGRKKEREEERERDVGCNSE